MKTTAANEIERTGGLGLRGSPNRLPTFGSWLYRTCSPSSLDHHHRCNNIVHLVDEDEAELSWAEPPRRRPRQSVAVVSPHSRCLLALMMMGSCGGGGLLLLQPVSQSLLLQPQHSESETVAEECDHDEGRWHIRLVTYLHQLFNNWEVLVFCHSIVCCHRRSNCAWEHYIFINRFDGDPRGKWRERLDKSLITRQINRYVHRKAQGINGD